MDKDVKHNHMYDVHWWKLSDFPSTAKAEKQMRVIARLFHIHVCCVFREGESECRRCGSLMFWGLMLCFGMCFDVVYVCEYKYLDVFCAQYVPTLKGHPYSYNCHCCRTPKMYVAKANVSGTWTTKNPMFPNSHFPLWVSKYPNVENLWMFSTRGFMTILTVLRSLLRAPVGIFIIFHVFARNLKIGSQNLWFRFCCNWMVVCFHTRWIWLFAHFLEMLQGMGFISALLFFPTHTQTKCFSKCGWLDYKLNVTHM